MILKRFNVEREANDEATIKALQAEGYEIISGEMPEKKEPKAKEAMTVKELVKEAELQGIEGAKNLKKAELLEVLYGEEAEPDDGAATADGGSEG